MRWTDDGSLVRAAPCLTPLPPGEDPSRDAFQFAAFTVSAVDFQKLTGIRVSDGAPKAFTTVKDTEVPALRSFVHRTVRVGPSPLL
jgi:hypothetical protein